MAAPRHRSTPPRVLTIAGSDSGGGAGIQADLKTIFAHGCYGLTSITSITAQNSVGVQGVEGISAKMVKEQIKSVVSDIGIDSVKTGMMYSEETIRGVVECLEELWTVEDHPPIVIDPVCVSTSGHSLLPPSALSTLRSHLIPWSTVLTPNIPEAEALALWAPGSIKSPPDMLTCAIELAKLGARYIYLKGGHSPFLNEKGEKCVTDLLYHSSSGTSSFTSRPHIPSKNTHGTGCTLSAAIASNLARGKPVDIACKDAADYVAGAIGASYVVGRGAGPVNHAFEMTLRSLPLPTPHSPNPFTDYLRAYSPETWRRYVYHPFPLGLAKGNLPLPAFLEFIVQDYHFLKHYARVNALAAYKSEELDEMAASMEIVSAVVKETQNHINYCETHHISPSTLLSTPESLSNKAYNRYVLDISARGNLLDLRVVTAPCLIGYGEVGKRLCADETDAVDKSDQNGYWKWIEEYGGEWYQGAVATGICLLEKTVAESPVSRKRLNELAQIFVEATELEIAFWDAAMAKAGGEA